MVRGKWWRAVILSAALLLGACTASADVSMTAGTQMQRGFVNDNVLHADMGDIHFSSYIPESYDVTRPYALFITLPGWEGLYFQGIGANMVEDFGTEAIGYVDDMIVLSAQLDDWGERSAEMTIALTEYFLSAYSIDPDRVYLHGMSGGGETGSLVLGKRPELYTAYLGKAPFSRTGSPLKPSSSCYSSTIVKSSFVSSFPWFSIYLSIVSLSTSPTVPQK